MEATVLQLHLTPKSEAAEEVVRKSGSSPRIVMRLMSTELVAKLYEYLVSKWKVSAQDNGSELVLFCRGAKMLLTDLLGDYQDNSVAIRVPVEYDMVSTGSPEEATTAASTPVSLPSISIIEPPEIPVAPPVTISDKKSRRKTNDEEQKKRRRVSTSFVVQSKLGSFEIAPACDNRKTQGTNTTERTQAIREEPSNSEDKRVESLYREMLDRERDLFMTMLESQGRWMTQLIDRINNRDT